MNPTPQIIEAIKQWEGLQKRAYRCPAGVLTIGYGHTGSDVYSSMEITASRAEELLKADVKRLADELSRWTRIDNVPPLSSNQFDALVSFAFNLGMSRLRSSTLWRKICHNPADPSIAYEFSRWVFTTVNGQKLRLPGLVSRRHQEAAIYFNARYPE